MVYCPKCGEKNPDTGKYCINCSASLPIQAAENSFEDHMQRFGKEMEKMGDHIERGIDHATNKTGEWYQKTFHVYGPLLSSFLSLIGIYIVIVIIQFLGGSRPWLLPVSDFLYSYLLVFFCIILVVNYITFFAKKYHKLQYVIPVLSMIGVFIWFWVISTILILIYNGLGKTYLLNLAHLLDILMIPIAILVLFIGYIKVIFLDKGSYWRKKHSEP